MPCGTEIDSICAEQRVGAGVVGRGARGVDHELVGLGALRRVVVLSCRKPTPTMTGVLGARSRHAACASLAGVDRLALLREGLHALAGVPGAEDGLPYSSSFASASASL